MPIGKAEVDSTLLRAVDPRSRGGADVSKTEAEDVILTAQAGGISDSEIESAFETAGLNDLYNELTANGSSNSLQGQFPTQFTTGEETRELSREIGNALNNLDLSENVPPYLHATITRAINESQQRLDAGGDPSTMQDLSDYTSLLASDLINAADQTGINPQLRTQLLADARSLSNIASDAAKDLPPDNPAAQDARINQSTLNQMQRR